jgi:hypothetical protein
MAKNDRIIPEHHPAILQAKAKGMITDLVGESKPTAKEQTLNPEVRTMLSDVQRAFDQAGGKS